MELSTRLVRAPCFFRPSSVSGIEIRYDRLTRFVDQLLNCISGIAAGIDGVPDDDLDLSRFQGEAFLGQNSPTSIDGNRQDGDLPPDGCYESPLFEFVNLPIGRPRPFGKNHYTHAPWQSIKSLVDAFDGLDCIGAVNEDVS